MSRYKKEFRAKFWEQYGGRRDDVIFFPNFWQVIQTAQG
jgi:hypothetical protein